MQPSFISLDYYYGYLRVAAFLGGTITFGHFSIILSNILLKAEVILLFYQLLLCN